MKGEFNFSFKGWIKALRCGKRGHVWWVLCDLLGAGARAQLSPIHPSIHCSLSVQPGPALGLQLPGRGFLGLPSKELCPLPLLSPRPPQEHSPRRGLPPAVLPGVAGGWPWSAFSQQLFPPKPVFLTLFRYLWV